MNEITRIINAIEQGEGVRTMIAKPKQKVVVCTLALAIGIATGWAVESTMAAAEVVAPVTRDWLLQGGYTQNKDSPILHREHAINWILNAQKATPDGGVSAWYNLSTGYCPTSYPEVTGYIIPTMFDLFRLTGKKEYRDAAVKMADWITSVQLPTGAVPGMDFSTPYVFDTGQCISGWVRAHKETGDARYLKAAEKAAIWLVGMQSQDGSFPLTPFTSSTHTYHCRVSWMLLQLYQLTGNSVYKDVAVRNLDWALAFQKPNGWCAPASQETTHFIAYAGRGMLESSQITGNKAYLVFAQRLADALIQLQLPNGMLYGEYDQAWKPVVGSSCLTGDLQIAIIWMRLYAITGEEKYRSAATKAIDYVLATQDIASLNPGINGSVAGSLPLGGSYCPNTYLSWATKFFIDAINLLLDPKRVLSG
jgi:rhamnogalacturonyl hydrolase YesR